MSTNNKGKAFGSINATTTNHQNSSSFSKSPIGFMNSDGMEKLTIGNSNDTISNTEGEGGFGSRFPDPIATNVS